MKLFVWDMHGTLERGNDRAVIDISNRVLSAYGYAERFSLADSRHLYGRKWEEYFTWLLGGGDPERDAMLRDECTRLADENPGLYAGKITPTPHAHAVLSAIMARHRQILISNARTRTLRAFTGILGYDRFFPGGTAFAVGGSLPTGPRTKREALTGYLRDGASYDEMVVIGDTPGDMELAVASGATAYLFAHPGTEFPDCNADYRIQDLRKILDRL